MSNVRKALKALVDAVQGAYGANDESVGVITMRMGQKGHKKLAQCFREAKDALASRDNIVVLLSDHPGEDSAYVMGIVSVPPEKMSGFEGKVREIYRRTLEEPDDPDNELLEELEADGCEIVFINEQIRVR